MNIQLQTDAAICNRLNHIKIVDMIDDLQNLHTALSLAINGAMSYSRAEKAALVALAGQVACDLAAIADRFGDTDHANDGVEQLRREFLQAWKAEIAADDETHDAAFEITNEIVTRIECLDSDTADAIALKALAVCWCRSGGDLADLGMSTDLHLASQIINALAEHGMKSVI
jgi:hypothetical protein